jgi:serine/threonine protein kinase
MNARPPLTTEDLSFQGRIVGGKYRVDELIGSGGMGTVWSGQHTGLGTRVAIKFIRPAFASLPDARQRFEIEARAAARLHSKHAVQVYDYGVTDDGLPYIVMEYLEGESLSEALVRRGPIPPAEVAHVIGEAALALQRAHAAGVVHRDLKPDNIFLATNPDATNEELPYTVKLVDFGIAKMFEAPRLAGLATPPPMGGPTQEGAVIGTPNFMAPEQLTLGGAPGPLTDLWSLGACAFSAMTARIPFEGDVLGDIVIKVCAAPMPVPSHVNPNVPAGFDAWFARACSRDPSKRFQTATELAESLANVAGTGRARAPSVSDDRDRVQYMLKPRSPDAPPLESIPVPAPMSSKTALLAGLVLGVTVMVGMAGALAWRERMNADERDLLRANALDAGASNVAMVDAAVAITKGIDAAIATDARARSGSH